MDPRKLDDRDLANLLNGLAAVGESAAPLWAEAWRRDGDTLAVNLDWNVPVRVVGEDDVPPAA